MQMTFEALMKIIELHQKYLRGEAGGVKADLSGSDLYGASLIDVDLRGANLAGGNLRRGILCNANLEGANLAGTSFKRGILEGANLRGSLLQGACLKGVNLERVDVRGANLQEADLEFASLSGAVYDSHTRWPRGFNPETAGARFLGSD